MQVRRRPEFEPAELPGARLIRWWVLAAGAMALAAGFLVLPYRVKLPAGAPTGAALTITVAIFTGFVVAILLTLYAIGRARLERAAYHANEIDIEIFKVDESGNPPPMSAAELTAMFKSRLGESRMYTPAVVPGVARSYDFIQIVETAGEASSGWWRVAARLMRLVRPPHAIKVSGRVAPGAGGQPHRLIIEVVRQPGFAASPVILSDDNWQRLLGRTANAVAALVIPRSKHCRNQQWSGWRGAKIPGALFDAYERANKFKSERRYDEALAEYHRAIAHDPANVHIRLEIGNLHERLDQHLAALVAYDDVVELCRRRQSDPAGAHEAALTLARYRRALVLGRGDWIAHDWWMSDTRTQLRQARFRESIRLRFGRYQGELAVPDGLLDDSAGQRHRARAEQLRGYLCMLAQYELELLIGERRPRAMRKLLSADTLRLGLLAIYLRRMMAAAELNQPLTKYAPLTGPPVEGLNQLDGEPGWPPSAESVRAAVNTRATRVGPQALWNERYNSACVYAIPLLPSGLRGEPGNSSARTLDEGEAKQLVTAAIDELDQAAASRHSGYLAQRRPWVMSEDPDLSTLRGQPEFRDFEMMTYSPDRPVSLRPRRVHGWEQATYTAMLVRQIAGCLGHQWRASTPEGKQIADENAVLSCHRKETEAWLLLSQLASAFDDWRARHQAVVALHRWSRDSGYDCGEIQFPAYTEHALFTQAVSVSSRPERTKASRSPQPAARIDSATEEYLADCTARMQTLAVLLHTPPNREVPRARRDFALVTETWAALESWFTDVEGSISVVDREKAFTKLLPR